MIKFKSANHYKYQLHKEYCIQTNIKPKKDIHIDFMVVLCKTGLLRIAQGYCWDGASGPTIDDKTNMRASLVHDALYQLMRAKKLSIKHRKKADAIMKKLLLEDGMWKFRAAYYYWAVRTFSKPFAKPQKEKIYTAP